MQSLRLDTSLYLEQNIAIANSSRICYWFFSI